MRHQDASSSQSARNNQKINNKLRRAGSIGRKIIVVYVAPAGK